MFRRICLLLVALVWAFTLKAQVQPSPYIPAQFFDNTGRPLAGGCVFTYQSGTTIPLITYVDAGQTFANPNPVILDSGGRARIFLTAAAYTLKLFTHGGTNCATGVQIWSIDGINPSANSILASNNVWTGTNTWNAAAVFNSSVTMNAGFTSNGPSNMTVGGSLGGSWTGSPTFAGTPNFSGGFTATTGTFTGQITSTVATGTPPFVIASTTQIPNLNVSLLQGCTWASPCPIGSTTPNTIVGTTITANTSLTINGSTPQTGVQGTDTNLLSAGTISGTSKILCTDANGGASTAGCPTGFSSIQVVKKVGPCTPVSGSSYDACSDTLTWSGSGFPDTNYMPVCTGVQPLANGGNAATNYAPIVVIQSYTTTTITVITQQERGATNNFIEISCVGVHP